MAPAVRRSVVKVVNSIVREWREEKEEKHRKEDKENRSQLFDRTESRCSFRSSPHQTLLRRCQTTTRTSVDLPHPLNSSHYPSFTPSKSHQLRRSNGSTSPPPRSGESGRGTGTVLRQLWHSPRQRNLRVPSWADGNDLQRTRLLESSPFPLFPHHLLLLPLQ
jgi:hypothetical protein